MSGGYTPLFSSLTTGTLCGRWPDIGLWPIILSLADRHGIVDVTPSYIAGITGLDLSEIVACMRRFCEPDPFSRSGESDGARLVLLEERRDWGWRIVNHGKYREMARKMAYDSTRTQSGADAERKRRERASHDVPTGPAMSRDVPLSEPHTDKTKEESPAAPSVAREGMGNQARNVSPRGSRLPDDWQPSTAGLSLPDDFGIDKEAAKFRDYWCAQPGQKGVKLDWHATWRNWVRRALDDGRYAKCVDQESKNTATFSGGKFQ